MLFKKIAVETERQQRKNALEAIDTLCSVKYDSDVFASTLFCFEQHLPASSAWGNREGREFPFGITCGDTNGSDGNVWIA